jgi:general secretion pathway protein K
MRSIENDLFSNMLPKNSQSGAILIIVLWFVMFISVLVATLASETRLSARAVFYNKEALKDWAHTLQALRAAEMEIMMARMPASPDDEERKEFEFEGKRKWIYRFNGQALKLAYPVSDNVTVRIYDNAGKINIQRLSRQQMHQLLKKRIGDDEEKLQALEDAWEDWIDGDDLKRVEGAEKEYYEELDPPYQPRNSRLETVEEILLIKGFAEVFKGIALDTVFTMYSNISGVNPNLATKEVLMLIPGLNEGIINEILARRQEEDFNSRQDFNEIAEPEQLVEFLPWINFSTGNEYTISIQSGETVLADDSENSEETTQEETRLPAPADGKNVRAFMVTVQARGYRNIPKVLIVNPYGVVPNTAHERLPSKEEIMN